MTLQDIFEQLSYGELRDLHIGNADETGITQENRHRLINPIGLGITALHQRFFLRRGEYLVPLELNTPVYVINQPDMFKIEQVFDQEGGELAIGSGADNSVSLDSMNTLRVPLDIRAKEGSLRVVYRANHGALDKSACVTAPESVQINLPMSHMEALLYFVASRFFNPVGAANVEFHEGNNYAQKYEMACRMLEQHGNQISELQEQSKFQRNGWI